MVNVMFTQINKNYWTFELIVEVAASNSLATIATSKFGIVGDDWNAKSDLKLILNIIFCLINEPMRPVDEFLQGGHNSSTSVAANTNG